MDKAVTNHNGHRERVRTLISQSGLDALLPHQILEFLLFYGIPYKDTKQIAYQLLDAYGTFDGVLDASVEDLLKIKGMTRNAAMLLSTLPEVFDKYRESKKSTKYVCALEELPLFVSQLFKDMSQEYLYLICLDAKYRLLHTDLLNSGNISAVHADVRKIVEIALRHNAVIIVLAHNHPSGVPVPSNEDVLYTAELSNILSTMDIQLLDHLVMTDDKFYSFCGKDCFDLNDAESYAEAIAIELRKQHNIKSNY